jgi:hypothetical protein
VNPTPSPRDTVVRLTCPLVVTPRGVRREYPAGSRFRVVDATPSAVLAQDRSELTVRLPAEACEIVALPGPGRGGRPRSPEAAAMVAA